MAANAAAINSAALAENPTGTDADHQNKILDMENKDPVAEEAPHSDSSSDSESSDSSSDSSPSSSDSSSDDEIKAIVKQKRAAAADAQANPEVDTANPPPAKRQKKQQRSSGGGAGDIDDVAGGDEPLKTQHELVR